MAQEYSDQCIFAHNPSSERKFGAFSWVGQNIAYWSDNSVTRYYILELIIIIKFLKVVCKCGLMKSKITIMILKNVMVYVVITQL